LGKILPYIYTGIHGTHSLFPPHFNQTIIFSADFQKPIKYKISRQSIQWALGLHRQMYIQTRRS